MRHRSRTLNAGLLLAGSLAGAASLLLPPNLTDAGAQQGYRRAGGDQIAVDRPDLWREWNFPAGTIEVTDDGVRSGRLRRNTNACLDIVDFLRLHPPESVRDKDRSLIELLDGIEAGTNRDEVVNVLDGDMSTFWEPDPPSGDVDLPSQWWFTVDLGRLVIIDRIVLRFAPEGEGDPFLLFDLLVSSGLKPPTAKQGDVRDYVPVIQTLVPNKTRRVFDLDLSQTAPGQIDPLGRFLQIVVRDSDLDRGRIVGEGEEGLAAWENLAPADRGFVEHTKRLPDGREVAVSREVWEQLEPARRGPIRYFERERPRLAELEVWGSGDEIIQGVADRGGQIAIDHDFSADILFDGDVETGFNFPLSTRDQRNEDELFFDLGSWYWIDAYRMVANFRSAAAVHEYCSYRLDFSDGARQANGGFAWTAAVVYNRAEDESFSGVPASGMRLRRHDFDPVKARFFRFAWDIRNCSGVHPLTEMQLFGSGYHPEVELLSNPIELPGSRNLTAIEWEADTPPGSQVVLQTKTGNVLIPDTLYFRDDGLLYGRGQEGADKFYSRGQKSFTKNKDKRVIYEEGPEWSPWSTRYEDPAGSLIESPSPRKILKIRASLLSDRPDTAATLRSLRLHFAEPVASRLLGEVAPTRVDALGIERRFTLHVAVDALETGFDELLIRPPSGMVLGEEETARDRVRMYAGRASQFEAAADDPGELLVAGAEVAGFGDSLLVRFPLVESGVDLVRLDFPATLYSSGGRLEPWLRNSAGEFWQRIDVGDATGLAGGNSLLVVAEGGGGGDLLQGLQAPGLFTPNGDGINDAALFEFSVIMVGPGSPAEVEIYDLAGRLLRRIQERRDISAGRYAISWDGLDESGNRVPPGLYTVRLGLDTATEGTGVKGTHVARTIAVAY